MIALFDVNILLALLDANHVHHLRAKKWFVSQPSRAWATCPMTQNGFIRIISQRSYPGRIGLNEATGLLRNATAASDHVFWPDKVSFLDESLFDHTKIHGPNQITDAYLLALAVSNGGRLVALDRSISLTVVRGAEPRNLVQL